MNGIALNRIDVKKLIVFSLVVTLIVSMLTLPTFAAQATKNNTSTYQNVYVTSGKNQKSTSVTFKNQGKKTITVYSCNPYTIYVAAIKPGKSCTVKINGRSKSMRYQVVGSGTKLNVNTSSGSVSIR